MSLYNMINGVTPATFFILPMLGKHGDEYPRFRDCFVCDSEHPEYDDHIHVYTRTGGGNRETYEFENEEIRSMPGFVTDFDDSFDCTYASWVFKVPERWADDFEKFKSGRLSEFSEAYKAELYRVYPKLRDRFDELFKCVPKVPKEKGAEVSEEKKSVVHDDELVAIKDSRDRDMPIFSAVSSTEVRKWIVAVSEHKAQLALLENVWPMTKLSKKIRDERYTKLLEEFYSQPPVQEGQEEDTVPFPSGEESA